MNSFKKINGILLGLLILGGVFLFISFQNRSSSPSPSLTPQPTLLTEKDAKQSLEQINKLRSHKFPAVKTEKGVDVSILPDKLKFLIFDDASELVVSSVEFENDKNGFQITYKRGFNVESTYFSYHNVLTGNSYKVVEGARNDLSAFLTYKNSEYTIRAEFLGTPDDQTNILIYAITQ